MQPGHRNACGQKNPKRYAYPQKIYINPADTLNRYHGHRQPQNKGELYLHISFPHINSFVLRPENEGAKVNTGFWGLALGFDYFHSKQQFIHLGISGISDFFVPFPAAIDISGEYELMRSRFISLSNNHRIKRFTIGYGLSYAKNTWDFRYYDRFDPPPPSRDPGHYSLGLVFPAYFRIGKYFQTGIVYRPTFFRPDLKEKFKYEHAVSIDLAYRIRLKK